MHKHAIDFVPEPLSRLFASIDFSEIAFTWEHVSDGIELANLEESVGYGYYCEKKWKHEKKQTQVAGNMNTRDNSSPKTIVRLVKTDEWPIAINRGVRG